MKSSYIMASVAAVALFIVALSPAEAKHRKKHHVAVAEVVVQTDCGDFGCRSLPTSSSQTTRLRTDTTVEATGIVLIPNPPGTWRINNSCAHRLAASWGLGKDLDSVSTWPRRFARASGPGPRVAAVRNDLHHVLGIIGGSPGGWQVVDFNSGHHLNHEYTVSSLRGYFFVDTKRPRVASK